MNKKELNMIKIYNPMIGLNSIETGRSSNNFNSDKKSFIDFTKKKRRKVCKFASKTHNNLYW